jgi:hypothetical protein
MAADGSVTSSSIAQMRARVHSALDAQDLDGAFGAINSTMARAVQTAIVREVICFGDAEVDELCLLIGRRWLETYRPDRKGVNPSRLADLYIASTLYEDGGHTPLIGDFVRAMPARCAFLAVTNLANQPGGLSENILRRVALKPSQVEVCQKINLEEKFAWLIDVIDRVRPDRIFLFNHQEDSVAVAACQPEIARETVFVHHSDRFPSVGAFVSSAVHVDVTPFCFHCCRKQAGHFDNRFVPLVAFDQGKTMRAAERSSDRSPRGTLDNILALLRLTKEPLPRGLRTAAAGSSHKFLQNYDPNYFDAIGAVLKLTKGWHVHIGDLPDDSLARFRDVLTMCNVDPERLVHVPHVPSVWRAMSDYQIDLYIGSFHRRGARTSVEVMGSGTPAVWHVTKPAALLHDTHMSYEGAATWRTLNDLLAIINRIDRHWLTEQSRLARLHYERNHHPMFMAACLSGDAISDHPVRAAGEHSSEPRLVSLNDLLSLR